MRRVINSNFRAQADLLVKLNDYHTSLGPDNYLDKMFALEGIIWTDIMAALPLALAADDLKNSFAASSHADLEIRHNKSKWPFSHMLGGGQNLKTINPSNKLSIAGWGFPVQASGKIKYPSNFNDMYLIWQAYFAKWGTYGVGLSPIETYNLDGKIIMGDDNILMLAAKAANDSAALADENSVINTEQRNDLWHDPIVAITKCYNLIKSTNKKVQYTLGLAGFQVAANTPGHRNQTSKALQASHVLIHGAIIGSVAYNNNAWDCYYIKGANPLGTQILFPKNSAIAITKGMSQFIFVNPDALKIAKILTTVRR